MPSLPAFHCEDGGSQAIGHILLTPVVSNAFLPLTLEHPMYAEAQPLMGVLDAESGELDPAGE